MKPQNLRCLAVVFALSCAWAICLISISNAQALPKPFRPLVFIPGLLGTELLDSNGNVIWGNSSSLSNFEQLELGATPPRPALHPGGLVKSISVLGPFWTIHQYDNLLGVLSALSYKEGENLFVLYYDWRLSNFKNAEKLREFIKSSPELRGKEIDILAHSMGGLIAKVYLDRYPNESRVVRLISLAVPSRGSMNALATMSSGWGGFANWLSGGLNTIRRVMFSFPSLYELFPSYDHCCRLGRPVPGGYSEFDPTNSALWEAGDWIPPELRVGARLADVVEGLDNARKMRLLLRQFSSSSTEQTLFAGDRLSTNLYLYVDPADNSWRKWHFTQSSGDGTVPLWSAANSDWPGRSLSAFADHANIFDDKWVVNQLQRILNKNAGPPPIANSSLPLARDNSGRLVEVSIVKAGFDKSVVNAGDQDFLKLSIVFLDSISKGDLQPELTLLDPTGTRRLDVTEITSDDDQAARTLSYSATVSTSMPGAYSVKILIPGMGGTYTRDTLALPPR